MTPFNPEQDERVPPIYGDSAMYIEPPVGDNQRNGVVPLDTLPAQWWNWLWNNVTKYCNAVVNPEIHDIVNELTNVLSAAGMTPDSVNQDQLLRAIRKIVDDTTATTSQKGVVKASNANGKVSVDNDGVMTANGLGDVAQLTTVIKTSVVNALNEVVTNIGALSGLSTTAKTDIVSAINELVTSLSTLNNNKVPNTRTVNGKALSEDITLSATDVGALPATTPIPTVPTKTSQLTNDGDGYYPFATTRQLKNFGLQRIYLNDFELPYIIPMNTIWAIKGNNSDWPEDLPWYSLMPNFGNYVPKTGYTYNILYYASI